MPPHPMDNIPYDAAYQQDLSWLDNPQQATQMQNSLGGLAGVAGQAAAQQDYQQFQNIYNAGVAAMQQAGWQTTGVGGLGQLAVEAQQLSQQAATEQRIYWGPTRPAPWQIADRQRREIQLKKDVAWIQVMKLIERYCEKRDAAERVS